MALKVQLDYLEPMVMDRSQGPAISAEGNIHTYRCGDFASIVSSTPFLPLPSLDNITMTSSWLNDSEIGTLRNTEKYLWGQMVVRRNRKMTKAIDALLKRARNVTFFFALGVGKRSITVVRWVLIIVWYNDCILIRQITNPILVDTVP